MRRLLRSLRSTTTLTRMGRFVGSSDQAAATDDPPSARASMRRRQGTHHHTSSWRSGDARSATLLSQASWRAIAGALSTALAGTLAVGACTARTGDINRSEGEPNSVSEGLSAGCVERGGTLICKPISGYVYMWGAAGPFFTNESDAVAWLFDYVATNWDTCPTTQPTLAPTTGWMQPWAPDDDRYYKSTHWSAGSPSCIGPNPVGHVLSRRAICPAGWVRGTSDVTTEPPFCYRAPDKADDEEDCTTDRPVDIRTGSKRLAEQDIPPSGPAALELTRFYNSGGGLLPNTAGLGFGVNWLSSYHRKLVAGSTRAVVYHATGAITVFAKSGSNWIPPQGSQDVLTSTVGADGAVAGWTFRSRDDETESYDASGNLLTITRAGGATLSLAYDGSNRLSSVSDGFGRSLTFAYDAAQRISSVTDSASQVHSYVYDAYDNILSVTKPGGAIRQYKYGYMAGESSGNGFSKGRNLVTGIVDEDNSRLSVYAYDTSERVTSSEHAGGVGRSTFQYGTYPPNNYPQTTVTDALGTQRNYQYAYMSSSTVPRWRLSAISQPCCGGSTAASFTYDSSGNIATSTDYLGRQTTFAWNSRNLPTTINEAVGTGQARTTTITWHATLHKPTQINEPGRRTDLTYDADGNLLTRTVTDTGSGASRTWTYTYNANKLLASVDGPLAGTGDTTTLAWSASGNLLTITNPLGHVMTYGSHDALGRPHTVTAPNGVVTQLDYTARGQLSAATIDPGGANPDVTSFAYDAAGQLVHEWRAIGSVRPYDRTNTYDAAQRPTRVTNLFGDKLDVVRDLLDHVTEQTAKDSGDTVRLKRQSTYDSLGRLATVKDASGTQVLALGYDGNGNATSVTLPQNAWSNAFDALNRRTSAVDSGSNTVSFTRSALDWVTQISDPRTVATGYTTNALGNLTAITSADRGTTNLTYDGAGNVASSTDAAGRTTSITRDNLERPTVYTLQGGGTIALAYDSGINHKGRLVQMTDPSGTTSWTYDARGRVTSRTQVAAGLTRSLLVTYDGAGRVSQVVYPSGRVVSATYATQGGYGTSRVASISVNGTPVVQNITYAPGTGALASWTYGNGQTMSRTYDNDGRVTNNGLGALTYDTAGRLTSYTAGAESYAYTFDAHDRLTGVTGSATQSYTYDANGNRTAQTVGGVSRTFTIAANSNRMTAATTPSTSFTYDATGGLTTDGTRTFTYDPLGRVSGAGGATYARNGVGQRVAKTVGGVTTVFFYDGKGRLLGEYDATGTTIQEYLYLGDMPVAIVQPSATYYVKADELNTPRVVVDAAGATVWSWARLPFGENAPTGSLTLNLRYPGQYFDAETGTHENNNRVYDPQLGRYLQADPIGLQGGLNTYAYVGSNPLQKVDPAGLLEFFSKGPTTFDGADESPRPGVHASGGLGKYKGEVNVQIKVKDGTPLVETDVRVPFGVGKLKGGISQRLGGSAEGMFMGFQVTAPFGEQTHRGKKYVCSTALEGEARNSWDPPTKPNEQWCEAQVAVSLKVRCVPKDNIGEAFYYTLGSLGFKDRDSFDPTEPFDPPGFMMTP